MVILDQGTRNGLKVGDVLLAARVRTWPANEEERSKDKITEKTAYYLGQLLVVRASETSSTCRILRSKEEILPGDVVTR